MRRRHPRIGRHAHPASARRMAAGRRQFTGAGFNIFRLDRGQPIRVHRHRDGHVAAPRGNQLNADRMARGHEAVASDRFEPHIGGQQYRLSNWASFCARRKSSS